MTSSLTQAKALVHQSMSMTECIARGNLSPLKARTSSRWSDDLTQITRTQEGKYLTTMQARNHSTATNRVEFTRRSRHKINTNKCSTTRSSSSQLKARWEDSSRLQRNKTVSKRTTGWLCGTWLTSSKVLREQRKRRKTSSRTPMSIRHSDRSTVRRFRWKTSTRGVSSSKT